MADKQNATVNTHSSEPMTVDDLLFAFRHWNFDEGGPWNSHDRALRCMTRAVEVIEELQAKASTAVTTDALIANAPDALKKLGARLADLLDADHWNNIEPLLIEVAQTASPSAVIAERDQARSLVAEANNSLYGSQGYFHSLNGGPFDKYHLARGIEELKRASNAAEARLAEANDRRDHTEGGLQLLLAAVKAGDPQKEIVFRIEEELRQLRTGRERVGSVRNAEQQS